MAQICEAQNYVTLFEVYYLQRGSIVLMQKDACCKEGGGGAENLACVGYLSLNARN